MTRSKLVPLLVLLASLAVLAGVVGLQAHDAASRDAELAVAGLKTDLAELQAMPFQADVRTGGSPARVTQRMRAARQRIADTLGRLRRDAPVPALDDVSAPLRAAYAAQDRIYALGASGAGYGLEADRLAAVGRRAGDAVAHSFDEAGRVYEQRSVTADTASTVGTSVALLALVAAFALLYRRSLRARAVAERLAEENARIALTDPLTGLPNRRALIADLEAQLPAAVPTRAVVLALFDLDGFKQYNDTFGHPAGDALLVRLGEQLRTAVDGAGTAYRMGGDEFCLLAPADGGADVPVVLRAADALSGPDLGITASFGSALVPVEARLPAEALRLADRRMYAHKAAQVAARAA